MVKPIIALIGNPNCGKTTLFNALTGANQRTGNWPGVTVDRKEGRFQVNGEDITLVDLLAPSASPVRLLIVAHEAFYSWPPTA